MFAFSFQKLTLTEEHQQPLDASALLSRLFMIMLENERLNKMISANSIPQYKQQISFGQSENKNGKLPQEKQKQYQLELELKQLKIDNLFKTIKQLQDKCLKNEKDLQEITQKYALEDIHNRQYASETKEQLNYFKHKYQEQLALSKKLARYQSDYKNIKTQLDSKNKDYTNSINHLKAEITKIQKEKEANSSQSQRNNKELKITAEELKNQIIIKQIQISKLTILLSEAPKLEQLNKWISKAKEYQSKQMQACDKISQMSQQICNARERYRKLQHEHKQLQKQKLELESTMASNKQNEDSMTIYFERLSTYQKAITELQEQIKKKQAQIITSKEESSEKIKKIQQERDNAINQWHIIIDQMTKQKNILTSMQGEMDEYYKQATSQRNMINSQNTQHRTDINSSKVSEIRIEPSTLMQNSKCSERSNRSMSLKEKRIQYRGDLDRSNLMDHIKSQEITKRSTNKLLSGRTSSEQQITYHSDSRQIDFPSRLTFKKNIEPSYKDPGCGQCNSRVNQSYMDTSTRAKSVSLIEDSSNRNFRNENYISRAVKQEYGSKAQHEINDEKKLLMQKLNTLKPQQMVVRPLDKSLSSIYNKSYRQLNNSCQSILKVNNHLNSKLSSQNKLQLGRPVPVEQKENMNDLIMKRYAHLMNKH